MSYKIVFFDIDGTLLDEEKQMPSDTAAAIRQLKSQNTEVVIATGRAPYFFDKIAKEHEIDSFVSLNGSYVVYKGKTIYERPIASSCLDTLQDVANKREHPLVFLGGSDYFATRSSHPDVIESFLSLKIEPPQYDPDFWQQEKVYQALLYCRSDEEAVYRKQFPDLHFIRWHRVSMDVIPGKGSKAIGIQAVLREAGIAVSEAVAFGDSLNDREMLSFVGLGIAMGNAQEQVKPFAKYVTKSVSQGGIVHGLQYAGLI